MKRGRPQNLKLDLIRTDGATQVRAQINEETVGHYADRLNRGDTPPPIVVYHDGSANWLADGFHRYMAARRNGRDTLPAIVEDGTAFDAFLRGLQINRDNGEPLRRADREHAAKHILRRDAEMSDRTIANHVGISPSTASKYRGELEAAGEIAPQTKRRGADGASRTIPPPPTVQTGQTEEPDQTQEQPETSADNDSTAAHNGDMNTGADGEGLGDDSPTVEGTPGVAGDGGELEAAGLDTDSQAGGIFSRGKELGAYAKSVRAIRDVVLEAIAEGDELYTFLNGSAFEADCNNILRALKHAKPHAVCPYCAGEKCRACKDSGFINQTGYDAAPAELKASAEE